MENGIQDFGTETINSSDKEHRPTEVDDHRQTTTTTTTSTAIKRPADDNHTEEAPDIQQTQHLNPIALAVAAVATASAHCVKSEPDVGASTSDEKDAIETNNYNILHPGTSKTKVEVDNDVQDEVDDDNCTELLPHPVDWKPQDKCNFCVNGKLLTVNERGELVPESGPVVAQSEQELAAHRVGPKI